MNAQGRRQYLPSPEQEMLLKASLLEGHQALEAWQTWNESVNLDSLDPQSYRMMPLLHRNLSRLGVSFGRNFMKIKGISRLCWYKNSLLIASLKTVLDKMNFLGISPLALKGTALVLGGYYENPGLRPMLDADLLVPKKDWQQSVGILIDSGWQPKEPLPETGCDPDLYFLCGRHSVTFVQKDSHQEIDLHLRVFQELALPGVEDHMISRATHFSGNGIICLIPSPEDMILIAAVHGIRRVSPLEFPSIQWIPDIKAVFCNAPGKIDWADIFRQAEILGLANRLERGINYINNVLALQLPPEALFERSCGRKSFSEKLDNANLEAVTEISAEISNFAAIFFRTARFGFRLGQPISATAKSLLRMTGWIPWLLWKHTGHALLKRAKKKVHWS